MTTSQDYLQRTLKNNGYSVTAARLTVFTALEDSEPQTMEQLVKKVSMSVNRASVYRIVDLFEKVGVVQRLQIGWKYKLELSNEFQEHHHHLICVNCEKITSFKEPANLDYLLGKIAEREDFTLQNHQLELQGLCSNCSRKS